MQFVALQEVSVVEKTKLKRIPLSLCVKMCLPGSEAQVKNTDVRVRAPGYEAGGAGGKLSFASQPVSANAHSFPHVLPMRSAAHTADSCRRSGEANLIPLLVEGGISALKLCIYTYIYVHSNVQDKLKSVRYR